MPRPLKENRCQQCRARRVKCDGRRPICNPCQRSSRGCQWIHTGGINPSPSTHQHTSNSSFSSEAVVVRNSSPAANPQDLQCREYVSTWDPEHALQTPQVAQIFRHYIDNLASWYDLNDRKRHFEDVVPIRARENPLLLSAILAFSAASKHHSNPEDKLLEVAEFYHLESVRRLISLVENLHEFPIGETLAAICLLRSYEIISQDVSSQNHLQGSYSLLVSHQIELTTDLLSAGFWNYLREDITVALIKKRCLMIELSAQNLVHAIDGEDDFPNYITFLLGKIINRCLPEDAVALGVSEWESLSNQLERWRTSLPSSSEPIHTPGLGKPSNYPILWTTRPWHVSSLQYYHTAMSILWLAEPRSQPMNALQRIRHIESLDSKLQYHATQICALAVSSNSAAVWVNSFGPIAFCGPWLREAGMRTEMTEELWRWGKQTGWPVSDIVDALSVP